MLNLEKTIAELVRVYDEAVATLRSDIANFAADGTLPPAERRAARHGHAARVAAAAGERDRERGAAAAGAEHDVPDAEPGQGVDQDGGQGGRRVHRAITSSMVARPATPPYSSTMMAM